MERLYWLAGKQYTLLEASRRIAELEAEVERLRAVHRRALDRYHEVYDLTGDQEAAEAAAGKECIP